MIIYNGFSGVTPSVSMEKSIPAVHIALAFDEGYIIPVYVLLASVFANNRDCHIHVHAIAKGVPAVEKAQLVAYATQQGGTMRFYELNSEVTQGFPVPGPDEPEAYITLAAYYRLFFPRLIPQNIDRLLYMDVDMLVVGSLLELYQSDLGGVAVGAVLDTEMPSRAEIGIADMSNYFNSGLLLMDMPRWQAERISERAIEVIRLLANKLDYHDQDALNVVFNGGWHRLDKRYNLMKAYIPHDLARRDYQKFLADKVIIHYNGRNKPWHRACENKLRFLYPPYFHQSPRAGHGRYLPKSLTRKAVGRLVQSRMLETYFNYPEVGTMWRFIKRMLGQG